MNLKLFILGGLVFLSTYCIKLQFDILQLRKQQVVLLSTNKSNYDRAENFKSLSANYQLLLKDIIKRIATECPDFNNSPDHPPELKAPSNLPNRDFPEINLNGSIPPEDQEYKLNGLMPVI